jgi:hypothetical protein
MKSLFVPFILIFLSFSASPATLTVDDPTGGPVTVNGLCSITEAIEAANTDAAVGDCPAGDVGSDTIELSVDITLSEAYENDATYGSTGTPEITSTIVLQGNGHSLQRDDGLMCNEDGLSDAGEFRLIFTSSGGRLDVNHLRLKHGCLDADLGNFKFYGGAIFNDGVLNINDSELSLNKANSGAGIYNSGLIEILSNTSFIANDGGALNNTPGGEIIVLTNNTFSANMARNYGAGIFNRGVITSITNHTFFENMGNGIVAGNSSGAIYNDGDNVNYPGLISSMSNSLFVNNSAQTTTVDCFNEAGTFNGNNNMSDNLSGGCPGLSVTALTTLTVDVLADNGCVTAFTDNSCLLTHALLSESEAVDTADGGTATDQRGFNHDGMRDIGAFELLSGEERCASLAMDTTGVFSQTVLSAHELNQAIFCANRNSATADDISLAAEIILTEIIEDDATYGHTGTRPIKSPVNLDGQGYTLRRAQSLACNDDATADDSEFRLMRVSGTGNLQLKNMVLKNGCANGAFNEESFYGGAIHNSGILAMANSAVLSNMANRGGGIFNDGTLAHLRSSTFYQNEATSGGGALFNESSVTTMRNNTFSGNDAGNAAGGAVANSGTINNIKNTTFSANNSQSSGGAISNEVSGSILSLENSLFHSNTDGTGDNDCINNGSTFDGSNNISDNFAGGCPGLRLITLTAATLGPLEDNGCTSSLANGSCIQTHALLTGSEAIDEGDVNATTKDQRSFLANGIRDVGAFEYEGLDDLIFLGGFE